MDRLSKDELYVFPNENDNNYYNIKVPKRFTNIVEKEHND